MEISKDLTAEDVQNEPGEIERTDEPRVLSQEDWEMAATMQGEILRALSCAGLAVLCIRLPVGANPGHMGYGLYVLGANESESEKADVAGFMRAAASELWNPIQIRVGENGLQVEV